MQVRTLDLPGPLVFAPVRHGDMRGFFSETFRQDVFDTHVGPATFVQDNHSRSTRRGVVRGLHCQTPPHVQGKLVRVTRGAVYDVVVDARAGSPSYGRHAGLELSADNWLQLWVPPGFLHGFCTLTDEVEFLYKVTSYYNAGAELTVAYDDPDLGINWPFRGGDALVSDKDRAGLCFRDLPPAFFFSS